MIEVGRGQSPEMRVERLLGAPALLPAGLALVPGKLFHFGRDGGPVGRVELSDHRHFVSPFAWLMQVLP
jgi:hypothetical protein